MEFAVIKTGGKQYVVKPGDSLRVEKLADVKEGDKVIFDNVLLVDDGNSTTIGTPTIDGAKVTATVLEQGRAKKVIIFKYKAKTRSRKKAGHRQPYTKVKIEEIK